MVAEFPMGLKLRSRLMKCFMNPSGVCSNLQASRLDSFSCRSRTRGSLDPFGPMYWAKSFRNSLKRGLCGPGV